MTLRLPLWLAALGLTVFLCGCPSAVDDDDSTANDDDSTANDDDSTANDDDATADDDDATADDDDATADDDDSGDDDDATLPDAACTNGVALPGDIPVGVTSADQATFDKFSWDSWLALNAPTVGGTVSTTGDNETLWDSWSSTVDFIECLANSGIDCVCPAGNCNTSGSRYYPVECQSVPGFLTYRVLDNIDKADDGFLEAADGGLSNHPVIDHNADFLRYEILLSPATYSWLASENLYQHTTVQARACAGDAIEFPCGESTLSDGDPATPASGALVLKNAWMEQPLAGVAYHTEDVLVWTSGDRNDSGNATCELKTMSLVGQHIARKTVQQPNWTWSTFEHVQNAPDCGALPPDGTGQGASVSTTPPAVAPTEDYNFRPLLCDQTNPAIPCVSTYNTAPTTNGNCPPGTTGNGGWCVDVAPIDRSQLCRQVPVADNYPEADAQNRGCRAALGCGEGVSATAAWCNYELISTQWVVLSADPTECTTDGAVSFGPGDQAPQVDVPRNGSPTSPLLGNTAMESYERANCNRCHSKTQYHAVDTSDSDAPKQVFTDYMYWVGIEVCQQWCDSNGVDPCTCIPAIGTSPPNNFTPEAVDCSQFVAR